MNAREAHYADYLGFLQSLHKAGADFFVEGGQAVNFWAEYIDSCDRTHALDPMRPFTSKDCDVWVSSKPGEIEFEIQHHEHLQGHVEIHDRIKPFMLEISGNMRIQVIGDGNISKISLILLEILSELGQFDHDFPVNSNSDPILPHKSCKPNNWPP